MVSEASPFDKRENGLIQHVNRVKWMQSGVQLRR